MTVPTWTWGKAKKTKVATNNNKKKKCARRRLLVDVKGVDVGTLAPVYG